MDINQSRLPRFRNFKWRFTVDHFIPKANGGSNKITNLVPACFKCNKAKGKKPPQEFLIMIRKGEYQPMIRGEN